jgi:S-adenosylmethionine synthetase
MLQRFTFVSESVTEGHPDKLCDQVSDAVIDAFLARDRYAEVDAECAVSTGIVFLAVHAADELPIAVTEIARETIARVGYDAGEFNAADCTILSTTQTPPPGRAHAVDERDLDAITAREAVTVFGYACRQTPMLVPAPIVVAHRVARELDHARRAAELPGLGPDATVQAAVEFEERRPARLHSLCLLLTGEPPADAALGARIREEILPRALEDGPLAIGKRTEILLNPDRPYTRGGPLLHSGLTGRKNAVDTYGLYARHSGAALSGKHLLRMDRMGAYAARHAAKNIVAAGLAEECEVQLSYSPGQRKPVGIEVETFGTRTIERDDLDRRVLATFDFTPAGILRTFGLDDPARPVPQFLPLATYGHVGREELDLPWEGTELVDALR